MNMNAKHIVEIELNVNDIGLPDGYSITDKNGQLIYEAWKTITSNLQSIAVENRGCLEKIFFNDWSPDLEKGGIFGGRFIFMDEKYKTFIEIAQKKYPHANLKTIEQSFGRKEFDYKPATTNQSQFFKDPRYIARQIFLVENNFVKDNTIKTKVFTLDAYFPISYSTTEIEGIAKIAFQKFNTELDIKQYSVMTEAEISKIINVESENSENVEYYFIGEIFPDYLDVVKEKQTEFELPMAVIGTNGSLKYFVDAYQALKNMTEEELETLLSNGNQPSFLTEKIATWMRKNGYHSLKKDVEFEYNRYSIDPDMVLDVIPQYEQEAKFIEDGLITFFSGM